MPRRPPRRYALIDRALTALLVLSERDRRTLLAAIDQLAEEPAALAQTMTLDWDGVPVFAVRHGRFLIAYHVDEDSGQMTVTMIRPSHP